MPGIPGIQSYTTVAASNITLFPENMAPSMVNDSARTMQSHIAEWYKDAEWINTGETPSRASATTFKIATDVTTRYLPGRRLKMYDATTLYGVITTSTYSAPDTTVTVVTDTGSLTTSLTSVATAALQPLSTSTNFSIGRKATDIASATTTDIFNINGDFADITGTVTITGLGTSIKAGIERTVRFTGALTLTHHATSLILPTAANITTAANDTAIFRALDTSGNALCISYKRADGTSVGAFNITGLTALTAPDGADELAIYDASATTNKKITLINTINGQVTDATPAPLADYVATYDASATNVKKVLLANLGAMTLIQSQAASNSATLDFTTGIDGTFDTYVLIGNRILPQTDDTGLYLRISTDGGSNYLAANYAGITYVIDEAGAPDTSANNTAQFPIVSLNAGQQVGNNTGEGTEFICYVFNPASTQIHKFLSHSMFEMTDTTPQAGWSFGHHTGTTAVNALRVLCSSGNIVSGRITLYGYRFA